MKPSLWAGIVSVLIVIVSSMSFAGEPVSIELVDGSIMNGEVVSVTEDTVVLKGASGQQVIERNAINPDSWYSLSPDSYSAEIEALTARINELELKVSQLRSENQNLRQQLVAHSRETPGEISSEKSLDDSAETPVMQNINRSPSAVTGETTAEDTGHWLGASGKRHNPSCRYYATGKGRYCGPEDGAPCKLCGG